ncbi:hypothetical protein [Bacteroides sp.]
MRKKFVTVALLGTLIFTSANFVGCKDYDDDINQLREQVDALKSISISDLASQLQSLKDADNNLGLANAKMEAAIAEIKTNIDALKEADKTLTSLVNGKVDQATYQAAIKELNEKCSDLSNKVAALAALESAVNDLKANKADNSAIEELKKAVEKLQSQDSEFATRISKLESTIENLNTVLSGKADQTTVDALSKAVEELKTSVSGIDAKIASALAPIQASITKLQEDLTKKADANTVAADIEKVKSEMTGLIDALKLQGAKDLADVKAELVGRIAALETAKGQMEKDIAKLEANIDALKDRITKLENQPATDLTEVKESIRLNKEAIDKANTDIGEIQGAIEGIEKRLDGLGVEVGAVKTYIDNAVSGLNTTISQQITTDIGAAVSNLKAQYEQADRELSARIQALESLSPVSKSELTALEGKLTSLQTTVSGENGLISQLNALSSRVDDLISDALDAKGPGTIDNAIAEKIKTALTEGTELKDAVDAAISSVTGRLDKVEVDLGAVLERIQSIVFVPQYKDNSGAIVPVYTINGVNGKIQMKFRVAPADKAMELAELATAKPEIFSFYAEEKLQSRATEGTASPVTITSVTGNVDGTIVIEAETTLVNDDDTDTYYPVALKLVTSMTVKEGEATVDKPVNDITTDYFNVRVRDIDDASNFKLASVKDGYPIDENKAITVEYTNTGVFDFKTDLAVKYIGAYNNLSLVDCGFTPALKVTQVYSDIEGKWLTRGKDDAKIEAITGEVFDLKDYSVNLKSSQITNRGKKLKLKLVDEAIFGSGNEGFELTYQVNNEAQVTPVSYGAILESQLLTDAGESTKNNFVWADGDANKAQTFVISADKKNKFATTVAGASYTDVAAAIAKAAENSSNVTHKVNGQTVEVTTDPTFVVTVDGTNDKLTITVPATVEYKTYVMTTTYATESYGNITITATLNLSYPGNDILLKHDDTQWSDGAFVMESGKATDETTAYTITDDLSKGYSPVTGVSYVFELAKLNAGKYEVTTVDNVQISGNNITISDKVDLTGFWVKATTEIDGHPTGNVDYFHVQAVFPITTTVISCSQKDNKYSYTATTTELNLGKDLSFKDRFGTELIKAGAVQEYAKKVYGMDVTLTYTIKDGIIEGGGTVSHEKFEINNGTFTTAAGYSSTKKVTVQVDVLVNHKFGPKSSATLTIVVDPTK